MKKIISKCLVIIMITLLLIPETVQAATVKINKTKAVLEVDATLKLKITGTDSKVTWSTSKKSVATVNKSGTVTAKAEGTAKITATIDGKDYSCSVYVVNSKNTSIAVGQTVEFTSGEYLVGEDIPAGTYTFTANSGSAEVPIYNKEDDFIDKKYNYIKYMALASKDSVAMEYWPESYSTEYKNLRLKNGNFIVIGSGLTIDVKRTK